MIDGAGLVLQCHSETNADGQTQQTTTILTQGKVPVKFADGAEATIVVVTPTWTPQAGAAVILGGVGKDKEARCWIAETTARPFTIVGWREYGQNEDGRWREVWNEQAPE